MRFRTAAVLALVLCLLTPVLTLAQHRGGFGGHVGLLMLPEVQRELKLDDTQIEQLKQMGQEMRARAQEMFQGIQNLPPDERQKRFIELGQATEKRLGEILDPRQRLRLRQLEIQSSGFRALGRKDVQDELKLSQEQRQRIQSALEGEHQAMRAAFAGFRPKADNMTQEERDRAFEEARKVHRATDDSLNRILTEPQRRQFQAMKGAPFAFPVRRFPGH